MTDALARELLEVLQELKPALRARGRRKREREKLEPLLHPLQHAAELLCIGRPRLAELVKAKKIAVTYHFGQPRIAHQELERYVASLPKSSVPKASGIPAPPPRTRRPSGGDIQKRCLAVPIPGDTK